MRAPFASAIALLLVSHAASAATLDVGPGKPYPAPCAAIAAAKAGDTIAIDASGTYSGDVCGIATSGLTIKGVNGRPKIDAGGKIAQSKGTWVVSGNDITIENVEIFGAHSANGSSPSDQNGAGIRAQGTNITVRGCFIHHNDNGFLGGSLTDGTGEVTIEGTEFSNNGFGDGFSHNVYVSHVAKLTFRFNYSHDVAEGHLLKSRADTNIVAYNRLTGEGGTNSYELDLPNGGIAYVIGNLIQQSATTHNPGIITFAEEGSHANGTPDHLFVVNNTVVNELGKGTFVSVAGAVTTPAVLANNIFRGTGTVCTQGSAMLVTNFTADPQLVSQSAFDYRLMAGSPCIDAGSNPGLGDGVDLTPVFEYLHPASSSPRGAVGAIDIGAYEVSGAGGGGGASGQGGQAGSGQAGSGQAGSGQAGAGQAGVGQAGAGQAGAGQGGSGKGGQAGTAQGGGGQSGKGGASGSGGGGGNSAGAGGSAGGSGSAASGGSGGAGLGGGSGKSGSGGGAGTVGGAPSGGAGGAGGASAAAAEPSSDDSGGCGCTVSRPRESGALFGLLVGFAALLRRSHRLAARRPLPKLLQRIVAKRTLHRIESPSCRVPGNPPPPRPQLAPRP